MVSTARLTDWGQYIYLFVPQSAYPRAVLVAIFLVIVASVYKLTVLSLYEDSLVSKGKTDACQLFCGFGTRQPLRQTPTYSVRSKWHGELVPGDSMLLDMVQLLDCAVTGICASCSIRNESSESSLASHDWNGHRRNGFASHSHS